MDSRQRIHELLVEWIDQHDYPPSTHDLLGMLWAEGSDIKTSAGVGYHLQALRKEGKIKKSEARTSAKWMPVVYPDGRPWFGRAQLLAQLQEQKVLRFMNE